MRLRIRRVKILIAFALAAAIGFGGLALVRHFLIRRHASSFYRAAVEARDQADYRKAEQALVSCIGLKPDFWQAYVDLVALLRRTGRADQAGDWIDRMSQVEAPAWQIHLARSRCYRMLGKTAESKEELDLALELAPNEPDVLLYASERALERGNLQEATDIAGRVKNSDQNTAEHYRLLGELRVRTGDQAGAIATIRRGLERYPEDAWLLWVLANLLLDANDVAEAETILARYRKAEKSTSLLRFLEARVLMTRGNWQGAAAEFEAIRPDFSRSPQLVKNLDFWLGACEDRLGRERLAVEAYRRAVGADPAWRPARIALAEKLAAQGNFDEAVRLWRGMPMQNSADWIYLAQLLLAKNLKIAPPQRQWSDFEEALGHAERDDAAWAAVLRAESLAARDRWDDAASTIAQAQLETPGRLSLWLLEAALDIRRGESVHACRLLEEARWHLGDPVPLRLARAIALLARPDLDLASHLRSMAEESGSLGPMSADKMHNGLARIAAYAGENELARRLAWQALGRRPQSPDLWLLLLEIMASTRDLSRFDDLMALIQSSPTAEAHRCFALGVREYVVADGYNRAQLLAALANLQRARFLRPDWRSAAFLAAKIQQALGQELAAAAGFLQSIGQSARDWDQLRHIATFCDQRQFHGELHAVLQQLRQPSLPLACKLSQRDRDLSVAFDDLPRELAAARQFPDDDRLEAVLWRARLLEIAGALQQAAQRPDAASRLLGEAEAALRFATKRHPEHPAAWAAYVGFLQRIDQPQEALDCMKQVAAHVAPDAAPFLLGQLAEMLGDPNLAADHYGAAIRLERDERLRNRAVEFFMRTNRQTALESGLLDLMKSGSEPPPEASPAEVRAAALSRWARENLASYYVSHGNARQREDAMKLLRAQPGDRAAESLKLLLLMSGRKDAWRLEAIQILESRCSNRAEDAVPDEQLSLINLYLVEGDWTNAHRRFRILLKNYPKDVRYLRSYVAACLDFGETTVAAAKMPDLESAAPGEFSTVQLHARLMVEQQRLSEALSSLMRFIEQVDTTPSDRQSKMNLAASAFEAIAERLRLSNQDKASQGFTARALELRRELSRMDPSQGAELAALLADSSRVGDALDLLEDQWSLSQPKDLANALMAISLRVSEVEQWRRLRAILNEAMRQFEKPAFFLLASGVLYDREGLYDEADAAYAEAIEKDPEYPAALNNRAFLAALRKQSLDEALGWADRAIDVDGRLPNLLDTRMLLNLSAGRRNDALADLKLLDARPPDPRYAFHKARVYFAMDRPADAAAALKDAYRAGLRKEVLHPLEQAEFERLNAALKGN